MLKLKCLIVVSLILMVTRPELQILYFSFDLGMYEILVDSPNEVGLASLYFFFLRRNDIRTCKVRTFFFLSSFWEFFLYKKLLPLIRKKKSHLLRKLKHSSLEHSFLCYL